MKTPWNLILLILAVLILLSGAGARGQDVVVYGTTPAGIALAVRAAREGKDVLLVGPSKRLGGMFSYGLGAFDCLYTGRRAPIFDEFRDAIFHHYGETYGWDSEQVKISYSTNTRVESKVAEQLLTKMVAGEKRITVKKEFYPESAVREGRMLRSVKFRSMQGNETFSASAPVFADCSYEGDLAAAAAAKYRTGREARTEFHEEHAGRLFMREVPWPPAGVDPAYLEAFGKLDMRQVKRWSEIIYPESTGEAEPSVQAFTMRVLLTDDPANLVPITQPEGYDRDAFAARLKTDIFWGGGRPPGGLIPNGKRFILQPEIIGLQDQYPEGTWEQRKKITEEHRAMTLKLLYFLQNDPSIPGEWRAQWKRFGLPADEFQDTGHLPDEIYVREARRIVGRSIFTENSAKLVPEIGRAPVVSDAIAMAEWYLDSHACTAEKVKDSAWEGEFYLQNQTWPAQVSLGSILPENIDNLVVPVCLSATHVGYGMVRVEPVWMETGEAAAVLIGKALQKNLPPAQVGADELVRELARRGFLLTFFNDIRPHREADWYPAVQYLGTKGFLPTYEARPFDPLSPELAGKWIAAAIRLRDGSPHDVMAMAADCAKVKDASGAPLGWDEFRKMLETAGFRPGTKEEGPLTRAVACRVLFDLITGAKTNRAPSHSQASS